MDREAVMAFFNKRPRIGALSTSNSKGEVNVAVFGSPQMIDVDTVVMGIGNNRSLGYLKENRNAAFIVMEPGETVADWKGYKIYLEATAIEIEGELYEQIKGNIAAAAGEAAAQMIKAAIRFKVKEIRDIIAPP